MSQFINLIDMRDMLKEKIKKEVDPVGKIFLRALLKAIKKKIKKEQQRGLDNE